jgi:hypothetical protein
VLVKRYSRTIKADTTERNRADADVELTQITPTGANAKAVVKISRAQGISALAVAADDRLA